MDTGGKAYLHSPALSSHAFPSTFGKSIAKIPSISLRRNQNPIIISKPAPLFQYNLLVMGLHLVAIAKLKFLSPSPSHSLNPIVSSLVWPFLLKLSFSFILVRRAHTDVVHASRLFVFQLGQIFSNPEPTFGNNNRLERALRLVFQRVTRTSRSQALLVDEDNFHILSMLAL
ncbi:hypothetical protein ACB092_10G055400 [Castanea dentata]